METKQIRILGYVQTVRPAGHQFPHLKTGTERVRGGYQELAWEAGPPRKCDEVATIQSRNTELFGLTQIEFMSIGFVLIDVIDAWGFESGGSIIALRVYNPRLADAGWILYTDQLTDENIKLQDGDVRTHIHGCIDTTNSVRKMFT